MFWFGISKYIKKFVNVYQFVSTIHIRNNCQIMSESRYFDNPFEDYSVANNIFEQNSCQLNPKTKEFLKIKSIQKLLTHLEENLNQFIDPRDDTIYTGSTGYALLYLHLYNVFNDKKFLNKCQPLIDLARDFKNKRFTYLCGDSGVLSIKSVVNHLNGNQNECNQTLNALKSMVVFNTNVNSDVPDELLYGRSGFLYSLLFVRKLIQNSNQIIEDKDIRPVVDTILRSGQKTSRRSQMSERCPLMYYWHERAYVGAAHGLIGIMALLLEAKSYLTDEELTKLVRPTIDFILSIRFRSGNLPSSLGNDSDRLVHWCHGSPGAVHLFCLAHQLFRDERYLKAAQDCCQTIWDRGLLRKGYGLCHGTAGNGYAFLRLFQLTNDPKQLYRAVKFGEWCAHYGEHGCRTPDRPFSLFEGLAGTVYYLSDLLDPMNSRFPAYQLS